MDSSHNPSLVKMCDGMCKACGAEGAMFEYAFATAKPREASSALS